jgi:hypothetical protein
MGHYKEELLIDGFEKQLLFHYYFYNKNDSPAMIVVAIIANSITNTMIFCIFLLLIVSLHSPT